MPAWNEARRLGQQARVVAQAERIGGSASADALPLAKERFKSQVCVYCGGNRKLRTGHLAITGSVFYCKDHAKQYQGDKPWEAKHKKGL